MKGTLPPSLVPPEGRHDSHRPTRHTGRDFARQLRTTREVGQDRTDETKPTATFGSVDEVRRAAAATTVPVIRKGADTAVLYPQSLHVVGYLSMLSHGPTGRHVLAPPPTSIVRTEWPSSVPLATYVEGQVVEDGGLPKTADPSGPLATTALVSQTVDDVDAGPPCVAGLPAHEARRFTRRFVKLAGTRVLLRDFSLSPAHLRAVLDAFSSMSASEGQPVNSAFINGVAYERTADGATLTKKRMNDHVG